MSNDGVIMGSNAGFDFLRLLTSQAYMMGLHLNNMKPTSLSQTVPCGVCVLYVCFSSFADQCFTPPGEMCSKV